MNLCIVTTNKNKYSETFIHAHIKRLPAASVLYGGSFPIYQDEERPLFPFPLGNARGALQALPGRLGNTVEKMTNYLLARHLRKSKVDVVLAEYGYVGAEIFKVCVRAEIPFIVHFHGADAHMKPILDRYGDAYKAMFQKAALIVAVSSTMKDALIGLGAPEEKLLLNPYGIDLSMFVAGEPEKNLPKFVSIGRFVEKKAPHLTLLAFKKAYDRFPQAKLIMIGDGPLLGACKSMAHALGLNQAVDFRGVLKPPEIAAIMRRSRAFLQHSVTASDGDSEGTPLAVLEAGASGAPVVGTRHAGIKDAVLHGETGFLVEEYDVDSMSDHILALATDPALAGKLGRNGRLRISEFYSIEKHINILRNALCRAATLDPVATGTES